MIGLLPLEGRIILKYDLGRLSVSKILTWFGLNSKVAAGHTHNLSPLTKTFACRTCRRDASLHI